ncbi:MAG: hypothetical protein AAF541_03560 [Pseudomonadota bacterium]
MATKYGLAKAAIEALQREADVEQLDPADVQEALMVTLIQAMKDSRGSGWLKQFLQYEVDMLGSGGVHDVPRGGGHS